MKSSLNLSKILLPVLHFKLETALRKIRCDIGERADDFLSCGAINLEQNPLASI